MSDKPRISMTPDELPKQMIHEVIDLPPEPQGLEPVACYGWEPEDIMPKRRPREMLYLGSLEWAWAPLCGRIEAYHLHRGRCHWLLYAQDLYPNDPEFAWMVTAFGDKKGADAREAVTYLLIAQLRTEAAEGLDHFHWINQEAFLSVGEWMSIGRAVWGSE